MGDDATDLNRFREKLDRELKSGLVSLVLLLVIDRTGPEYGYRILRTVQESSAGRLAFKEGTAYPLLANLERMGLVTSFWSAGGSGPPRKYYQVTNLGRQALGHVLADWEDLTRSVTDLVERLPADGRRAGAPPPTATPLVPPPPAPARAAAEAAPPATAPETPLAPPLPEPTDAPTREHESDPDPQVTPVTEPPRRESADDEDEDERQFFPEETR